MRWEALRICKPRWKVLSRGKLEKNGLSTFERAPDILSKGVKKIEKIIFVSSMGVVPTVGPRRDLGTIFGVIFQGLFFWKKVF